MTAADEEITDEQLLVLRSRATELLLRNDWDGYIKLYSGFISLLRRHLSDADGNGDTKSSIKAHKSLCLAYSSRAEAWHRLGRLQEALGDCEAALTLDQSHRRALICKGKILLDLDRYSAASSCFQCVLDLNGACSTSADDPRALLSRSRRLESQARSGVFDLSDWVLQGFTGEPPELAEYVGPVEVRRSEHGGCGGRGLFATRNVDAGTPLIVTKAVVIRRGILPAEDRGNTASTDAGRLMMWKDFVDKLLQAAAKSPRALELIYSLSTGEESENESGIPIPDMAIFRPEAVAQGVKEIAASPDTERILSILDVNSLTEDVPWGTVLGSGHGEVCAVGLWILASFLNHSCRPNARRLHVGDTVVIHAARDVKAGEELTTAYFDVLQPLRQRREMAKHWGFQCRCKRCAFEETVRTDTEEASKELEGGESSGGTLANPGSLVAKLEQGTAMRNRGMEKKGFLRASFWAAYAAAYGSEKCMRKWGRKIPEAAAIVDNVTAAVGGDERVLKVLLDLPGNRQGGGGGGVPARADQMDRMMELGKGIYGKMMRKKHAMRVLLDLLKQN